MGHTLCQIPLRYIEAVSGEKPSLVVLLNLTLDAIHKCGRFARTFLEKGLKLILNGGSNPFMFNSGLMLLLAEVDLSRKNETAKKMHLRFLAPAILKWSLYY